jgi:hypothetical protein
LGPTIGPRSHHHCARDSHHPEFARFSFGPITACVDGPRLAREICCLAQFELLAVMCPASHEGGPCQVASRVIVHAQFAKDYIIRPRLSSHHAGFSRANLTSGGIASHHCPASGTRELQEDGTTLCRRRFRTMPDNGDTSLDRSTRTYRLEPTSQKIRTPSSRRHPAVERPVSRIATG